jgi:hypothetical protein
MISPIHATALAAECEHFSSAFSDVEGEICDLTRMALLAELQLYEAVGELPFADGEYTEAPKVAATVLAVLPFRKSQRWRRDLRSSTTVFTTKA